ncbi:hypothetical protein D3C73_1426060 [compost metagenome]
MEEEIKPSSVDSKSEEELKDKVFTEDSKDENADGDSQQDSHEDENEEDEEDYEDETEDSEEDSEEESDEDLLEKPLGELNFEELTRVAKLKGVSTKGLNSKKLLKNAIKAAK